MMEERRRQNTRIQPPSRHGFGGPGETGENTKNPLLLSCLLSFVPSCSVLFLCLCDLRVLCGKGDYFVCVGLPAVALAQAGLWLIFSRIS
jgi:hypothetical protein